MWNGRRLVTLEELPAEALRSEEGVCMPNRADVVVVTLPPEPQRVLASQLLSEGYALVAVTVGTAAQQANAGRARELTSLEDVS